jgi:hypothetical protein
MLQHSKLQQKTKKGANKSRRVTKKKEAKASEGEQDRDAQKGKKKKNQPNCGKGRGKGGKGTGKGAGKGAKRKSRAASKRRLNTKMVEAIGQLTTFVMPSAVASTIKAQLTADTQAGAGIGMALKGMALNRNCPIRGSGRLVTKARQGFARAYEVAVRRMGLLDL